MNNTNEELNAQELYEGEEDSTQANTFLTFVTDGLTFGVSTDKVIEIITNYNIRPLPLVPEYVRGIINLRGQIIPIIDMRLRLGKEFKEYTSTSCVVILDIGSDRIGICVDSVSQVLTIDTKKASPIPMQSNQKLANSMISIGENKVVLLLDCQSITQP